MRIIDVDAHLHEPLDWVERTDPEPRRRSSGRRRASWTSPTRVRLLRTRRSSQLPEQQRPQNRLGPRAARLRHHLEMTDVRSARPAKRG